MDPAWIQAYVDHYEQMDFCAWNNAQPVRKVYSSSDYMTAQGLESSILYKEWLSPMGMYYSLFANCAAKDITYGVITLMRSQTVGDFGPKDRAILDMVNDHLSQRLSSLFPRGITRASFEPQDLEPLRLRYQLTEREAEIVGYLGQDMSRADIAATLVISGNTLKKHIANIYRKMGVNSQARLIARIAEARE